MTPTDAELPVLDASTFWSDWKEGVAVLVDKPKGWSSFKVVGALRSFTKIRRIGHAGTLDPMATGLLICCVGRTATRQIDTFVGLDKVYVGTLRLGETTASYDAETPVEERANAGHLTNDEIARAFARFEGEITQRAPMYSAVKVRGNRLYKLARKGVTIETPERHVTIYSIKLQDRDGVDVRFRVTCSKGTYIRTLAHDIGTQLGVGAHLIALRRTAIGPHAVERAVPAEKLVNPTPHAI